MLEEIDADMLATNFQPDHGKDVCVINILGTIHSHKKALLLSWVLLITSSGIAQSLRDSIPDRILSFRTEELFAPDSVVSYRWGGSSWSQRTKEIYNYRDDGQIQNYSSYFSASNAWLNFDRDLYSYDETDLLIEQRHQGGEYSDWFDEWRQVILNDDAGRMIQVTQEVVSGENWTPTERCQYTYTGEGLVEDLIFSIKIGSTWINDVREHYSYSSAGQLDSITYQFWDYDLDIWYDEEIKRFSYDSEGHLVEELLEVWATSGWRGSQRVNYDYTEAGLEFEAITSVLFGSNWLSLFRRETHYDASGLVSIVIDQEYAYDEDLWIDTQRDLLERDSSGRLTVLTTQNKNLTTNEWENDWRSDHFYDTPVSIVEVIPSRFQLDQNYPNPFNPTTTIRFSLPAATDMELVIFDVMGRRIQTLSRGLKAAGHYTMSWNGQGYDGRPVDAGIYFARLSSPDHQQVIKMTIVK